MRKSEVRACSEFKTSTVKLKYQVKFGAQFCVTLFRDGLGEAQANWHCG